MKRREAEIAQGLRDAGGALIGGLDVMDYGQGVADFEDGIPPPAVTSTSYDLGRARAAEKLEAKQDVREWLREQERRSDAVMRDMLNDHPAELAKWEQRMAETDAKRL